MTRFILPLLLLATAAPVSTAQADYSQHPKASQFTQEMLQTGLYTRAELDQILSSAQRNPKLIESEKNAPEKTRTWPQYQGIFIKEARISNGVRFMRTHKSALTRAEQSYGLPPSVVTAIIGVETLYGGYTGPHRVLDSLATQGFDHPTRSPFFYNEFKEFLLLCKEKQMDPQSIQGSYAGAMGLPQFMPSNYRKLGMDYDGDGKVNLWSPSDAIGSAANYLLNYQGSLKGWKRGQAVAIPVQVTGPVDIDTTRKTATYTWKQIKHQIQEHPIGLHDDQAVGLLALDHGETQEYWIALPNFYSIMSYNPRVYYAMAVFQLSEAIAQSAADSQPPVDL